MNKYAIKQKGIVGRHYNGNFVKQFFTPKYLTM